MLRFRRQLCVAAAVLAGASGSVVAATTPAAAQEAPTAVTAGGMPTPQTNGMILSVAIVGNTVYAGGKFNKARPAGVAPGGEGEVTRNNLLAFDLRTGELLPWAPQVTGTPFSGNNPGPYCKPSGSQWVCDSVFRIKASPDGSRIYVGGDFDRVNGQWRSRLAAFDTAGALVPNFRPQVGGRVRGISVTSDTVYIGGGFGAVNGTTRQRLAALGSDGALRPFAPTADGEVFALAAAPAQNRVVVGGAFNQINGTSRRAIMGVDAATGANVSWQWRAPSNKDVVTDIVTDEGGTAYLGAYNYGGGDPRFEGRGAINIADGSAKWFDGCYGDTQAVSVSNGVLYSASHAHQCLAMGTFPETRPYRRLLAESTDVRGTAPVTRNHVQRGDPIPEMLPWFPNTNGGPSDSPWSNGPWAVASNGDYVVVGGEFTTVNGKAQQSLTRFAARGVPGAVHNGPQTPFRAPTVTRNNAGQPVVNWQTTWDAQNSEIRYELFRVGNGTPIHTVTRESRFWNLPNLSYVDTGAPQGQQRYWVRAIDADGARIGSPQSEPG
ncbi:MAG: hypothetical protein GEU98_01680 [Pseudonocardiaceae bacterium]|nr:hypothetical protein [Pseudonocardiaceae bacterium]